MRVENGKRLIAMTDFYFSPQTGLAECLRSEFQLYDIDIHAYFPGTILSPGFEEENKTKPELTKKLEGGDSEGQTPEQCARGLLKGELYSFLLDASSFVLNLWSLSLHQSLYQALKVIISSSPPTFSLNCFVLLRRRGAVSQATIGCLIDSNLLLL